jgi:plastocyanin
MNAHRLFAAAGLAFVLAACGGGDGPTPPGPTVNTVVITAPAAAPTFGALGRTMQFTAEPRDAAGAVVSGVTLTWASSNTAVATVSATGLVTAAGNGTTSITASGGGKTSTGVTVTVAQVGVSATITPANPAFGAIGSTRQMAAQLLDSTGNALASPAPVVWSVSAGGTISVSASGLVTAVAVTAAGTAPDSVRATVGPAAIAVRTAVTVSQVPASIVVAVPAGDSVLRTTGSARQLTATVRDSNANALGTQPTLTWTSSATGVATVDATGLVTAVADGNAAIQAGTGGITASRTQVVARYAQTFTINPSTPQAISTDNGTLPFTGTAQDSSGANLTIGWQSRSTTVATVSPATGTAVTVSAAGNGVTYIVMSGGSRTDSTQVTVTNQSAPPAVAVDVGDNFFRSGANSTTPAVDTIGVGGTVTWTWVGSNPHSVRSTGSPSFTSSTIKSSGTYAFTFNNTGTFTYDCAVHGAAMTGTVVVQ